MKKLLLIAALAIFGITGAKAQEGFKIGTYLGLPMGDIEDGSSFNIGVDFQYHFFISNDFDLGATAGYTVFLGKDQMETIGFYPIAASARYSFSDEWFAGADLGYAVAVEDNFNEARDESIGISSLGLGVTWSF